MFFKFWPASHVRFFLLYFACVLAAPWDAVASHSALPWTDACSCSALTPSDLAPIKAREWSWVGIWQRTFHQVTFAAFPSRPSKRFPRSRRHRLPALHVRSIHPQRCAARRLPHCATSPQPKSAYRVRGFSARRGHSCVGDQPIAVRTCQDVFPR
jgi:hypothetical protein